MKMKMEKDEYDKRLRRLDRLLSLENPMRRLSEDLDALNNEEQSFCIGQLYGWGGGTDAPAAQAWLRQREELIENERRGGRYFWLKE